MKWEQFLSANPIPQYFRKILCPFHGIRDKPAIAMPNSRLLQFGYATPAHRSRRQPELDNFATLYVAVFWVFE